MIFREKWIESIVVKYIKKGRTVQESKESSFFFEKNVEKEDSFYLGLFLIKSKSERFVTK